jgi:hypothetical protein
MPEIAYPSQISSWGTIPINLGDIAAQQIKARVLDTQQRIEDLAEEAWLSVKTKIDDILILTQAEGDAAGKDDPEFERLVEEWQAQRSKSSSFAGRDAILPAYQRIIGMGPKALPLILRALAKQNDNWYWALKAISGEDPVSPEDRGKTRVMREAWLRWGRAKGYVR